jgi:hypothetical protein
VSGRLKEEAAQRAAAARWGLEKSRAPSPSPVVVPAVAPDDLGLRRPLFAHRSPERQRAALAALEGLYRDFLQVRLDSGGGSSVDHEPPTFKEPV